jgi:hypothetical protein
MTPQIVSKAMIALRGKPDATGFARPRHASASSKSQGVAQTTPCSRSMAAPPIVTAAVATFAAPAATSTRPHAAPPAFESP